MRNTSDRAGYSGLLSNPSACTLVADDLQAVFLPGHGMLGTSLRHRGEEILRRVHGLDAAAAKGSTAGIPLLHPWANRLDGPRYHAAGREVELDPSSPILHLDEHGLPMHGVPWSLLSWEVTEERKDRVVALLDWTRSDLLAVFPFRHRLEMTATLLSNSLTLETTLVAGADGPVTVCFGFHLYFGLPNLPEGVDKNVFTGIETAIKGDRYAFFTEFFKNFYNTDILMGKRVSEQTVQASWNVAAASSATATFECVSTWHSDFRKDVARIDVPTLVMQGDTDRILPITAAGLRNLSREPAWWW